MSTSKIKLLFLYLTGFFHVFLHVLVVSMLMGWGLQLLAMLHGETYDWGAIFIQLFLSISLLVFFPGQHLWTYRLRDARGVEHTIIGRPPEDERRR